MLIFFLQKIEFLLEAGPCKGTETKVQTANQTVICNIGD